MFTGGRDSNTSKQKKSQWPRAIAPLQHLTTLRPWTEAVNAMLGVEPGAKGLGARRQPPGPKGIPNATLGAKKSCGPNWRRPNEESFGVYTHAYPANKGPPGAQTAVSPCDRKRVQGRSTVT
uniref:Uncharacterized protein n=1 Tax=Trichuris muris TaxID=70415 RepID=A0A5S6QZG2_TRIMR